MLKVEGFAARTGGLESLWLCINLGGKQGALWAM